MTRKDAVSLREKLFPAERRPIEAPVRMCGKFLEAFVLRIGWQKKCGGIGSVEHDEDAQLGSPRKERIQPRIIDAQERAIAIMQAQAQVFPYLHTDCASGYALLQSL